MGNRPQVTVQEPQTSESSFMDVNGTIHIRSLTLPLSNLVSQEFQDWLTAVVHERQEIKPPPIPARNASKSEWDRFDAQLDERLSTRYLARARKIYPVKIVETRIAGIRVGMVSPKNGISTKNQSRVLINLHGGGFVCYRGLHMGELESIPVASIGQMMVITIDYRQAPFYQYPTASEDVEAVYRELLKQYTPGAIGIFGCSAGGALTAQAVTRIQAKGLPRPGAVGIFSSAPSPTWTNQGDSGIWWSTNHLPNDQLSETEKDALAPVKWYMENADRKDPLAYPESSDAAMERFPPTLLLSGTRAFDMSPIINAHTRFLRLGVDAFLYLMEGGTHGAHVFATGTPEAHHANAYIARWFDQHLTT